TKAVAVVPRYGHGARKVVVAARRIAEGIQRFDVQREAFGARIRVEDVQTDRHLLPLLTDEESVECEREMIPETGEELLLLLRDIRVAVPHTVQIGPPDERARRPSLVGEDSIDRRATLVGRVFLAGEFVADSLLQPSASGQFTVLGTVHAEF